MSTEHNPFAALLDGVPKYALNINTQLMEEHWRGKFVDIDKVLAALAAAVPADLAEAGKVLEWLRGIKTADGFEHTQEEGVNVLKLKRKPDPRGAEAADLITALLARIAAQEAQMKRGAMLLEATMTRAEAAEAKLAEWQASQHYRYIGANGQPVLARDLEDRAEAAETALAASEASVAKLVEALDAFPADWRERAHSFKGVLKLQAAWADGFNAARAAITEAGQ